MIESTHGSVILIGAVPVVFPTVSFNTAWATYIVASLTISCAGNYVAPVAIDLLLSFARGNPPDWGLTEPSKKASLPRGTVMGPAVAPIVLTYQAQRAFDALRLDLAGIPQGGSPLEFTVDWSLEWGRAEDTGPTYTSQFGRR
jgi:hypothetical protein